MSWNFQSTIFKYLCLRWGGGGKRKIEQLWTPDFVFYVLASPIHQPFSEAISEKWAEDFKALAWTGGCPLGCPPAGALLCLSPNTIMRIQIQIPQSPGTWYVSSKYMCTNTHYTLQLHSLYWEARSLWALRTPTSSWAGLTSSLTDISWITFYSKGTVSHNKSSQ